MHPRSAEEHLALVAATGEVPVYNVAENGVDGGGKEIERGEVRVDPGGASVLLISWAKTRHAVVSFGLTEGRSGMMTRKPALRKWST